MMRSLTLMEIRSLRREMYPPGFDHGHCKQRRQCDLLYCEGACRRYAPEIWGRATAKSFNVRSRFVHFEFFRLQKDPGGLGRLVGLEVNMRPSGGFSPDMMVACTTDVYKIWADVIAFDKTMHPGERQMLCIYPDEEMVRGLS